MSDLNAGIASFGLCRTTSQIWAEMKTKGNRSVIMRQLLNIWAVNEGSTLASRSHTGAVQQWICEGMEEPRCNPSMTNRCPICWPHAEYVKIKFSQRSEGDTGDLNTRFVYVTD